MSLKTRQVTFRNLQLPTRDKKAIQSGVGFELEDELPFSIENAAYDYSIISQSKAGTQVHVAATLKKQRRRRARCLDRRRRRSGSGDDRSLGLPHA